MKLEEQITIVQEAISDFEFVEKVSDLPSNFQSSILALGVLLEEFEAQKLQEFFTNNAWQGEKTETEWGEKSETAAEWVKRMTKKLSGDNA